MKKTKPQPYPSTPSRTPSLTPSPPPVPIEEEPVRPPDDVSMDMYTQVQLSAPVNFNLTVPAATPPKPSAYSTLTPNLRSVVDTTLARLVQDLKMSTNGVLLAKEEKMQTQPPLFTETDPFQTNEPEIDSVFSLNLHADLFDHPLHQPHQPFESFVSQLDTVYDPSYPVQFG